MTAVVIVLLGLALIVSLWASGSSEYNQVREDSKDEK